MTVARLVTLLDLEDDGARSMSVSARHEAVLADGRRIVLLDDRGWTSWPSAPGSGTVPSIEDIEQAALGVVGADEVFGGRSQADMEDDHWAALADVLRQEGVVADARVLKLLPHDVVLSERLLARTQERGRPA